MTANGLPDAMLKAPAAARWAGDWPTSTCCSIPAHGASRGEYGLGRHRRDDLLGRSGEARWSIVLMTQSSPANPDSLRQRFKAIAQRAVN